jgi:gamma-tubulin complex component 3
MIDYRVHDLAPLATVFTEDVMNKYKKVFNFLWRIKRIEHQLSNTWRTYKEHIHKFEKIKGMKDAFHRLNLCHHEMLHFMSTIHNYIMVEVLESAWKVFLDDLKVVKDLDELIEVQSNFVDSILDKALINEKNNELFRTLQKILNQVYVFTHKKDSFFYPGALMEYDRQHTNGSFA